MKQNRLLREEIRGRQDRSGPGAQGERGFVFRDEIVASQKFEFLGMVLDGTPGRLRHTARRCWRQWYALAKVWQRRRATGDALRVLGRHLCHHFGLFPPALSVLEEIFSWLLQHLGRMAPLTHSFRFELPVARALLFVMGSNFWRDLGENRILP